MDTGAKNDEFESLFDSKIATLRNLQRISKSQIVLDDFLILVLSLERCKRILHLGTFSFSERYGNAEIGWMTFELSDISITERKGKQLSEVDNSAVH